MVNTHLTPVLTGVRWVCNLHIPAILSAYFVEGVGDLAEGAVFYGFHQLCENVAVIDGHFAEFGQCSGGASLIAFPEGVEVFNLLFLFLTGASDDLPVAAAA